MKNHNILSIAAATASVVSGAPFPDPHYSNHVAARQAEDAFDWAAVKPNASLEYHECYEGIGKCARLQLPLDWSNLENEGNSSAPIGEDANGDSVTLAILTLPANVTHDDPKFGGTILYNPGGPNGAGVTPSNIATLSYFQNYLNSGDGLQYEILLFDPRGVGMTWPPAECYETEADRQYAVLEANARGDIDTDDGLVKHLQWSKGWGALCKAYTSGSGPENDIKAHMSSASVARDMVAIVDRLEEQRHQDDDDEDYSVADLDDEDKPKLLYYGVSYGTYLGNVFASMFPERVGRMMLDAVVDPEDYTQGKWLTNLQDTEDILDYMLEQCYNSNCTFRRSNDTSWSDMRARVDDWFEQAHEAPIPSIASGRVHLTTAGTAALSLLQPLYAPDLQLDILDTALTSTIYDGVPVDVFNKTLARLPEDELRAWPRQYTWDDDVHYAVRCSDSYSPDEKNLTWAQELVESLGEQSPIFGRAWAVRAVGCAGWDIEPKYRFTGPFTSPDPDDDEEGAKAHSAPILFTSARKDNVTPARNAVKAAEGHPGSSVVIQEGHSHGVGAIAGPCLQKIIKTYMNEGKVPESGTVCEEPSEEVFKALLEALENFGA